MAKILSGGEVARSLKEKHIKRCADLKAKGVIPRLDIIRVGDKKDDILYEKSILRVCSEFGIETKEYTYPEAVTELEIKELIEGLNSDVSNAVMMLRPTINPNLDKIAAEIIDPKKDVDGMSFRGYSKVYSNTGDGFFPCTPLSVMEILKYYEIPIKGMHAVVLGRSLVVGKPLSMLLMNEDATVTVCNSKTKKLKEICKSADIIVSATGHKYLLDSSFVSNNQCVIDVGIATDENGKLCGDVNYNDVEPIVSALTPVKDGVGSVTTMILIGHVLDAVTVG